MRAGNGGSTISGSVSEGKPPSSGDSSIRKREEVSTGNVWETALQVEGTVSAVFLGRERHLPLSRPLSRFPIYFLHSPFYSSKLFIYS